MQKTALTAGLLLMLAALAVPGSAYHITGEPTTVACSTTVDNSHEWCLGSGVLVLCEQDDALGTGDLGVAVGYPGQGGLCFMSAGHGGELAVNGVADCESTDGNGRSDGTGYNDTVGGENASPVCAFKPAADTWYNFTVTDLSFNPNVVTWTAQVGAFQCTNDVLPGETLAVQELFAYWANNGHVTTFPDPTGDATEGTYMVEDAPVQSGPGCDADSPGAPMHILP